MRLKFGMPSTRTTLDGAQGAKEWKLAELERIFHSFKILWDPGPEHSNFALFLTISYFWII